MKDKKRAVSLSVFKELPKPNRLHHSSYRLVKNGGINKVGNTMRESMRS